MLQHSLSYIRKRRKIGKRKIALRNNVWSNTPSHTLGREEKLNNERLFAIIGFCIMV